MLHFQNHPEAQIPGKLGHWEQAVYVSPRSAGPQIERQVSFSSSPRSQPSSRSCFTDQRHSLILLDQEVPQGLSERQLRQRRGSSSLAGRRAVMAPVQRQRRSAPSQTPASEPGWTICSDGALGSPMKSRQGMLVLQAYRGVTPAHVVAVDHSRLQSESHPMCRAVRLVCSLESQTVRKKTQISASVDITVPPDKGF